jgi:hypothetical protein
MPSAGEMVVAVHRAMSAGSEAAVDSDDDPTAVVTVVLAVVQALFMSDSILSVASLGGASRTMGSGSGERRRAPVHRPTT